MTKPIDHFIGKYHFLSNFYRVNIEYEGHDYPTVEHAYQAAKTNDPHKRARIRAAATPGLAKAMGRRVKLIEGWDDKRVDVMRQLLRDKFAYPDLMEKLLETGDAELVEGNDWGDTWWGVYYPPKGDPIGENMLGKLLMQIRSELRSLAGELDEVIESAGSLPPSDLEWAPGPHGKERVS